MSAIKWPNGKRVAVTITFDCDFETVWLAQDASNVRRPGTLSQGTYEAKVGLPKVLAALAEEQVPGTFFVPGWVADNRTAAVEAIAQAGGHEIGHHGYTHKWLDPNNPAMEKEELEMGIESLKRVFGAAPLGFRAPFGEISPNMLGMLVERGFLYDSSMLDDIVPYRHVLPGGRSLVELPWHRSIADAPYMLPSAQVPRPILTNEHVLTIWKAEFDEAHASGGYFDMLLHPQAIGRPSRIRLLRDFLAYAKGHDNVWFATCTDVAKAWLAQSTDSGAPAYSAFLKEDKDGRIIQA